MEAAGPGTFRNSLIHFTNDTKLLPGVAIYGKTTGQKQRYPWYLAGKYGAGRRAYAEQGRNKRADLQKGQYGRYFENSGELSNSGYARRENREQSVVAGAPRTWRYRREELITV